MAWSRIEHASCRCLSVSGAESSGVYILSVDEAAQPPVPMEVIASSSPMARQGWKYKLLSVARSRISSRFRVIRILKLGANIRFLVLVLAGSRATKACQLTHRTSSRNAHQLPPRELSSWSSMRMLHKRPQCRLVSISAWRRSVVSRRNTPFVVSLQLGSEERKKLQTEGWGDMWTCSHSTAGPGWFMGSSRYVHEVVPRVWVAEGDPGGSPLNRQRPAGELRPSRAMPSGERIQGLPCRETRTWETSRRSGRSGTAGRFLRPLWL